MKKPRKITICLIAYDKALLEKPLKVLWNKLNKYNLKSTKDTTIMHTVATLPVLRTRYTVLRSPHVNKTARDQFEKQEWRQLLSFTTTLPDDYLFYLLSWLHKSAPNIKIKTKICS